MRISGVSSCFLNWDCWGFCGIVGIWSWLFGGLVWGCDRLAPLLPAPSPPAPLPPKVLCTTRMDGYCRRLSFRDPPLSFGHFPRERGKPWRFAKVSPSGRGVWIVIGEFLAGGLEELAGVGMREERWFSGCVSDCWGIPTSAGMPRSHRFACSRPLTLKRRGRAGHRPAPTGPLTNLWFPPPCQSTGQV